MASVDEDSSGVRRGASAPSGPLRRLASRRSTNWGASSDGRPSRPKSPYRRRALGSVSSPAVRESKNPSLIMSLSDIPPPEPGATPRKSRSEPDDARRAMVPISPPPPAEEMGVCPVPESRNRGISMSDADEAVALRARPTGVESGLGGDADGARGRPPVEGRRSLPSLPTRRWGWGLVNSCDGVCPKDRIWSTYALRCDGSTESRSKAPS